MNKERAGSGITGGLFLIGLGVIWLADWWWPGIMVVLGIAVGSGLVFRGHYFPALVVMAIFFRIPILTETQIPWDIFEPTKQSSFILSHSRTGQASPPSLVT
jgi:hypothetical protein